MARTRVPPSPPPPTPPSLGPLALSALEAAAFHRFFRAVADAVSIRVHTGESATEEDLSFVFCDLFDGRHSHRHHIAYGLEDLRAELSRLRPTGIDVRLSTRTLPRPFEGKVAQADIGMILRMVDRHGAESIKGALFQAKRLFPSGASFRHTSRFGQFDRAQFARAQGVAHTFGGANGFFYLFYSPILSHFGPTYRGHVEAREAGYLRASGHPIVAPTPPPPIHPVAPVSGTGIPRAWQEQRVFSEELLRHPGVRVSGLAALAGSVPARGTPSLANLYTPLGVPHVTAFDHNARFEDFADFMVFGVLACTSGSPDPRFIRICAGLPPDADGDAGGDYFVRPRRILHISLTEREGPIAIG